MDARLHYALAGRKRQTINLIQEETNTNIYLPPTTSTVFFRDREPGVASPPDVGMERSTMLAPTPTVGRAETRPGVDGLQDSIARLCVSPVPVTEPPAYVAALKESRDRIYITGDAQGVLNAKTLLAQLAYARVGCAETQRGVERALTLSHRNRACLSRRPPSCNPSSTGSYRKSKSRGAGQRGMTLILSSPGKERSRASCRITARMSSLRSASSRFTAIIG